MPEIFDMDTDGAAEVAFLNEFEKSFVNHALADRSPDELVVFPLWLFHVNGVKVRAYRREIQRPVVGSLHRDMTDIEGHSDVIW